MVLAARRALIAGLGLIGGSIGMALRASGWHVSYLDPAVELDEARAHGAADDRAESLDAPADLIILATPVDVACDLLRALHEGGPTVTSVCSVFGPLHDIGGPRFIAGHPMAGSAERLLSGADAGLFRGRRWFIESRDPLVDEVIAACGAIPDVVDAATHDHAVALTSHLPQLLSTALAAAIEREPDLLRFAGTGLSTFLRLAGSDASVWQPIISANRPAIAEHQRVVAGIVDAILDGDSTAIFEDAQKFVRRLP